MRLAVTQTPMKDDYLKLAWKDYKEQNNKKNIFNKKNEENPRNAASSILFRSSFVQVRVFLSWNKKLMNNFFFLSGVIM